MTAAARRSRVPDRTRQLVDELHERALRSALTSLPAREPRRHLYDLLPEYPKRPGKGLRPVLCMAACAAYGGDYRDALPFAAALELLHNAWLPDHRPHTVLRDNRLRRTGPVRSGTHHPGHLGRQ